MLYSADLVLLKYNAGQHTAEGGGMGKRHGEATAQGEYLGRHLFLKRCVTISSRNRESSPWQDNKSKPDFFHIFSLCESNMAVC